jgi:hypothetical protein
VPIGTHDPVSDANLIRGFSYTVGGLKDGGSTMTVEQRLQQLEKRNKRLTVALTMMAVERHF